MAFSNFGEAVGGGDDPRRLHPAGERNKGPILDVLRRVLPARGLVLEVASGTGQHTVFFAEHLPGLQWQPTDPDAGAMSSIEAWRCHASLPNVRPPMALDAMSEGWPVSSADAVLCINMLQVAPWGAALGLLAGAARVLPAGGPLCIYSPLSRGGVHTSEGNKSFDERLRARDPSLGLRDAEELIAAGLAAGLVHEETVPMPANNTLLLLRRC